MTDYTKEEWQRLIEKYNREMMSQYASVPKAADPPPQSPAIFDQSQETAKTPESEMLQMPSEEAVEDPESEIPQISSEEAVEVPANDPQSEYTDIGYLQIRVSTEDQAIPIEGAVVTVSHQNGDRMQLDRTMITDRDGLTPIIELPTKDRALSLVPGNPTPYAVYTVNVTTDGYFPKRFIDLPIYGGVTAIQSVSMIPLPEAGDDDVVLSYPQSGPSIY